MSDLCHACGNSLPKSGICQVCLLKLGISEGVDQSQIAQQGAALPSIETLNESFPQLEITRLVGRGGMGAIYHARQTSLERDVALKIIAKEVAGDTAFIERFEREAKALARLSHPNIVTVFDFGRTVDGQAYLMMEYVDGINLREAMSSGSVDGGETLDLVTKICDALRYAHGKGVVHRDIKPENILLGEDGHVKVADFGIAKIVDQSVSTPTLTATRQVLGSLHYLAPEHLESPSQVDHRVDLYALGVVFYELLTGQLPLGRYEPPSVVRPNVDSRIDPIVMKALCRSPSQRYQSANQLSDDLKALSGIYLAPPSSPAPAADHTISTGVSVPFTQSALYGAGYISGRVRSEPGQLRIEYRMRDAIFGAAMSKLKTINLPSSKLTDVSFVPGVFSPKLLITTDSSADVDCFNGSETGRLELKIKRGDEAMARQVVHVLGLSGDNQPSSIVGAQTAVAEALQSHSGWVTFAWLMIFCGIFNAGVLGIAETLIAEELDDIELIAAAVGTAVLLGPIVVAQLVGGVLCLATRRVAIGRALATISLLPFTPGWFMSAPVAVWALRWMRRLDPQQTTSVSVSATQPAQRSESSFWSTTALFLLPESRWGRRMVALVNGAGIATAISVFAIFQLGIYPITMNYRVVDSRGNAEAVVDRINQRLYPDATARLARRDDHDQDGDNGNAYVQIRILKRNQDRIAQRLSIVGRLELVWLTTGSGGSTSTSAGEFVVAPGLRSEPYAISSSDLPADHQLAAWKPPMRIESSDVASIEVSGDGLVLKLSSDGRRRLLADQPPSNAKSSRDEETGNDSNRFVGAGLVIDGVIEGFAAPDSISIRELAFQLSPDTEALSSAITAALRGPEILSELELID